MWDRFRGWLLGFASCLRFRMSNDSQSPRDRDFHRQYGESRRMPPDDSVGLDDGDGAQSRWKRPIKPDQDHSVSNLSLGSEGAVDADRLADAEER
jgi:hypothetical protein